MSINYISNSLNEDETFNKWFAGSKAVDQLGRPAVMYHGTRSATDFGEFSVDGPPRDDDGNPLSSGSGPDPTAYLGAHFAQETSVANRFADPNAGDWMSSRWEGERGEDGADSGSRVIPVYLNIKKPARFKDEKHLHNFLNAGFLDDEWAIIQAMNADGVEEETEEAEEWFRKYDTDTNFRREQNEWILRSQDSDETDWAMQLANQGKQKLVDKGFDGVVYGNRVEGGISWIAFHPEQIKSSVGNKGTWSADSPDITEGVDMTLAQRFLARVTDEDAGAAATGGTSAALGAIPSGVVNVVSPVAKKRGKLKKKHLIDSDEVSESDDLDWLNNAFGDQHDEQPAREHTGAEKLYLFFQNLEVGDVIQVGKAKFQLARRHKDDGYFGPFVKAGTTGKIWYKAEPQSDLSVIMKPTSTLYDKSPTVTGVPKKLTECLLCIQEASKSPEEKRRAAMRKLGAAKREELAHYHATGCCPMRKATLDDFLNDDDEDSDDGPEASTTGSVTESQQFLQKMEELVMVYKPMLSAEEDAYFRALQNNPKLQKKIPLKTVLVKDLEVLQFRVDQTNVNRLAREGVFNGMLVVKRRGQMFIKDGTHRYNACLKKGVESVKVRLVELEDDAVSLSTFARRFGIDKDEIIRAMDSSDRLAFEKQP